MLVREHQPEHQPERERKRKIARVEDSERVEQENLKVRKRKSTRARYIAS